MAAFTCTPTHMTSIDLSRQRILLTQADQFMGPALHATLAECGAEVVADTRSLDSPAAAAAAVASAGVFGASKVQSEMVSALAVIETATQRARAVSPRFTGVIPGRQEPGCATRVRDKLFICVVGSRTWKSLPPQYGDPAERTSDSSHD